MFSSESAALCSTRMSSADDGNVPRSLQKALQAVENRGNPFGKLEKKRAQWTKQAACKVAILDGLRQAETLYFVDSVTSYDDRIQAIGPIGTGMRPSNQDGGLGFPFRRETRACAHQCWTGAGPISIGVALINTASMTWLFSKYTLKFG